ncbi:MAG TPA: ATP-binding protein [Candidatus Paceibacterota bacterium]
MNLFEAIQIIAENSNLAQTNISSAVSTNLFPTDVQQENMRFEALLSSIGDGTVATDRNGRVIFMNRAAEDLLGWKFSEIRNKIFVNMIRLENESVNTIPLDSRPMFLALLYRKRLNAREYYYVRKDGVRFPVSITVSPVIVRDTLIGAIEVFQDITKEREVDRAKTEFVSLASHQLRTPLSTIGWCVETLLSGDVGKITKQQKDYLEEIHFAKERMSDLVEALLNVSRLELGTFMIEPELIDLAALSRSVLQELQPEIAKKQIQIQEHYAEDAKKLSADPNLMRMIFQNLLTNAVRYTREHGAIKVRIHRREAAVLIEIQDNGLGIPANQQSRVFTKLFRADNARTIATDGTGLGLYIVKSILDSSGGKIWFASKENIGTTFYVALPIRGMQPRGKMVY